MDDRLDLICNILSVAVISLCAIMKLPQIVKVVKAGTTQGISLQSLLMEYWCFSIMLAYPIANGYPLSGFIEMAFLNIQDVILLIMVLKDRGYLSITTMASLVAFNSVMVGMAITWLPSWLLYIATSTVTPIGVGGKLTQLVAILRAKDAGTVSPLSWGIGSMSASARVFTGWVQTGDWFLVFMSTQAAILNGAISISARAYRPKHKQQ